MTRDQTTPTAPERLLGLPECDPERLRLDAVGSLRTVAGDGPSQAEAADARAVGDAGGAQGVEAGRLPLNVLQEFSAYIVRLLAGAESKADAERISGFPCIEYDGVFKPIVSMEDIKVWAAGVKTLHSGK